MGLLKHKRTRNTIAAEPTPRSSEGSVTPRLQDRIASGTTNANIANPKQHCRPASANSAGPTCSRTKARYDTDIPANLTTSSTGDNLDLHNKRGRSRGASESNASDGHDFVQSPACNGHIPKPEDVTHSNSHDRTSCSKGNICIEGYDMIRGGEGCTGQRGPLGSPLPTAEDQNISTQQRHGKENHTLRHAGPTRQAGGNSICNSKEDYLRRRRRRAALDGTIAGSVDRSPLRNSRNSREGPELKSADVRRRPKIAEVRQQVGRTSLRRKPERRVPRNKQADRRKLFCNRILNNGDTLHLKRRVSGSSSENEYLDRDDVWRQGKTKRMGWHGGNEAALGNASNASCLTDPRFMPISAVEKLFSGKRLAAVQARDPQTAAAVRAARANRLVTIRSIQNKKNMSRRYGGTSSSVAKAGCPMPMVRVREKREGRGRPMTMGKRECGRKNWDIKPTVKIRPKSAPPMRSTCGSVVARDGGDHYPRVHTVENGKGIAKNNGETDGRASSRIGTASRSSSARTSGTETSDITRSCSTCSLSTTRDTHRWVAMRLSLQRELYHRLEP